MRNAGQMKTLEMEMMSLPPVRISAPSTYVVRVLIPYLDGESMASLYRTSREYRQLLVREQHLHGCILEDVMSVLTSLWVARR